MMRMDEDEMATYVPPTIPINWGVASHQWLAFIIPTNAQSVWGMDSFLKGDVRLMASSMKLLERGYVPNDFMSMHPNLKSIGGTLSKRIIHHWLAYGEKDKNDEKFNEYSPGIDIYSLNGVPVMALHEAMEETGEAFYYDIIRRTPSEDVEESQLAINLGEPTPHRDRTRATAILNTQSNDGAFIEIVATDDFVGKWERGSEALHIDRIDLKINNALQDGFKSFIEWVDNIDEPIYLVDERGDAGIDVTLAPLGKGHPITWIYGEIALNKRERSVATTREDIRAGRFVMFRL